MQFTSQHKLLHQSSYVPSAHLSSRIPSFHPMTFIIDEGVIFTQRFKSKCFTINYHIIDLIKPVTLHPQTPHSILTIHYMLKNNIDATLHNVGPIPLRENEYNMFMVISGDHQAVAEPGIYHCFHIDIDEKLIQELEIELPFFGELLFLMKKKGGVINAHPYIIEEREQRLIHDILHCTLTGKDARLFLHNCCTELLVLFTENFLQLHTDNQNNYSLSDSDIAALYNIKQFITDHIYQEFDWDVVAEMFGISENTLRFGFPRLFFKNASYFLLKERLSRAFELLATSVIPIEVIMHMVGYKDLPIFTRSFTKFFGCTPDELRN